MKNFKFILLLLAMSVALNAWSQDQATYKHPKVIEVEMIIAKDATAFLQQRFPSEPIYVNVEIDPLRRSSGAKNEQLPYFYSEDEVGDEWDAIDTPMVLLLSRIKKATIKVEVSNTFADADLIDVKEKLYQQLKLIPGRDSISIEKKAFASKDSSKSKDLVFYYYVTGLTCLLLVGLYAIVRFGIKPMPNNANLNPQTSQASAAPSANPVRQSNNSGSRGNFQNSGSINSKVNGDINFKDSIRASDILKEKLQGVVNAPVFPMLSDLLLLEELADKSLSSFGAFVFEMPRKHQQKIFFRGKSDKWFKGYIEAASVDMDCFITAEKMLRNRIPSGSEKWEELIIQVWRMGNDAHLLLKQIDQEDAFSILAHLPKSISVPTAKKSFPGRWARILEVKDQQPIEDEARIEDYLERSLRLKPYFSFKSIDDYKKDLELVEYLRSSSVKDEEEIYESLSPDSQIPNIRSPFYIIFKAENEDFKKLFPLFELHDWALASINSPREYIKKITAELDDKKKYLFSGFLKQLDESPTENKDQIELREEIAKAYQQILNQKKMNQDNVSKKTTEEMENDELQAA